jgi:hypothetical protein
MVTDGRRHGWAAKGVDFPGPRGYAVLRAERAAAARVPGAAHPSTGDRELSLRAGSPEGEPGARNYVWCPPNCPPNWMWP